MSGLEGAKEEAGRERKERRRGEEEEGGGCGALRPRLFVSSQLGELL